MITTCLEARPLLWYIVKRLSKAENRKGAVKVFTEAMKDGRMTVPEWAKVGSAIGIFGKDK